VRRGGCGPVGAVGGLLALILWAEQPAMFWLTVLITLGVSAPGVLRWLVDLLMLPVALIIGVVRLVFGLKGPSPGPEPPAIATPQRWPIPAGVRFDVLKRDGYKCRICGRTAAEGARLEIDHVVPVARGGTNELTNLQVLCHTCNRGKGPKSQ
jgi:hypothetical protein